MNYWPTILTHQLLWLTVLQNKKDCYHKKLYLLSQIINLHLLSINLHLLSPLELISLAKADYRAAFYVHYFYIIYSVATTKTVCKSELNQSSTNIKRKS
ncbi:hypothetical protein EB796_010940 [Bugula neritina]|uniref:Uncharacterized protein n=1 Tax=Bugula neritina TaxID=10212 RepID=A0A7J7JWG1_BUGNE|nr:hypothetical protein EB796_010940 [Bugula neritina]